MIKKLLTEAQAHLNYFFTSLDVAQWEEILSLCFACKGLLLFAGVGKSGLIAEKIATTLASTGSKALYLPVTNFLHGDIGFLSEGDLVFFLSKSGESEELLDLLPFIRTKKAQIIAVTSVPTSKLATQADFAVTLPMQRELCQFDLVPTTSSELQLIFGDILAVALMQQKKFTLSEYALNHPLGTIGKRITIRVKDLMLQGEHLPLCTSEQKLCDVLVELTQKKCGALIVTDEQKQLQGIFTDGDLRRALQQTGSEVLSQTIGHLMTKSAISTHPHVLAFDALKTMQTNANKWVTVVPVLEEKIVVGLLRMHDIIQAGIS